MSGEDQGYEGSQRAGGPQDWPQIEHFSRQPDGKWTYSLDRGLEASVAIPSIACCLKLAEVYDRVRFAEEEMEGAA